MKLEGGEEFADVVKALVRAGIPVLGHIGLNPQRVLVTGYRMARGTLLLEKKSGKVSCFV